MVPVGRMGMPVLSYLVQALPALLVELLALVPKLALEREERLAQEVVQPSDQAWQRQGRQPV